MITPSYGPTATERVLPRLALDFTTGVLDPRVTVTRALNTATRYNSSGLIETVNANLPRFDYNPATLAARGLLIEETRANLFIRSEELNTAAWTSTDITVSANALVSPSGAQTADLITEGSAGTAFITTNASTTGSATYSASIFMRRGNTDWLRLLISDGTNSYILWFNTATGAIGNTSTGGTGVYTGSAVQALPNSWYRVTLTGSVPLTTSAIRVNSASANGSSTRVAGATYGLWGAQLEAGAFATSYIPTTTTSLTRNADVVSMTGTNFSGWYSSGAGAFQVVTTPRTATGVRPIIQADDASANNLIALRQNVADPELYVVSGGAPQTQIDAGTVTANTAYKLCGTWATDNCAAAKDGAAAVTDLTATIPTPTQLRIGNDGTNYGNMWVAKVNYWPQRVTNAETQAFSK